MEHLGACKFCGQMKAVRGAETMTEEAITAAATYECNCEAAQVHRAAEDKKTRAMASIKTIFEEDGETIRTALEGLVEALAWKRLTKVTVVAADGIKATMTAKDSAIKVERTETIKTALED